TASFCAGGILERHPRLRVAFLEGNCSWVPFLLWRMDEHWEWLGDIYARELTMAPKRLLQAPVLRVGGVRRGAGEARHRRHRRRPDRLLAPLPPRRLAFPAGGGVCA